MKTTLDLPDELIRAVKILAVKQNSKLKDVVTDLLRLGLSAASEQRREVRNRVQFPLVQCAHPEEFGDELTPERVAAILADGEVSDPDTLR